MRDKIINATSRAAKCLLIMLALYVLIPKILSAQEIIIVEEKEGKENNYKAVLTFNGEKINMAGKSTYAVFPAMYSFYLDQSDSIRCGIHVYQEGPIVTGVYKIGTEENPRTGVRCARLHDGMRERIRSASGQFVIEEIKDHIVSGFYEFRMVGDVSGIEYMLEGDFVSSVMQ